MQPMRRLAALSATLVLLVACSDTRLPTPALSAEEATAALVPVGARHPAGVMSAALPLAGRPHGVAALASGRFCVTQIDANSLTCGSVSERGAKLGKAIPVGTTPAHVALSSDGTEAYTANQFGNSLSIVDVAGAQAVATVPLSNGGFNVLADPASSRVYVTTASGLLHVVNAATRTVVGTLQLGPASNGLALDGASGTLYVSSIAAGTVSAVNTGAIALTRTYQVSGMPQRIALLPDGKNLAIASETVGLEALRLVPGDRTVVTGVAPGAVGLAVSPDGKQVYVTNPPAGTVTVVDVATRTVVNSFTGLASPRNVAFALNGLVALVTGEGGFVYVIK